MTIDMGQIAGVLEAESNYSFEVKTLKILRDMRFKCEHAGSYVDPVSKKIRQFDIRATLSKTNRHCLATVECKALSDALVVHCSPRASEESFFNLYVPTANGTISKDSHLAYSLLDTCKEVQSHFPFKILRNIHDSYGPYLKDEPVGKAMDMVRIFKDKPYALKGDGEVFEKYTQAISSAGEMLGKVIRGGLELGKVVAVVPVLVVPVGKLVKVGYDANGAIVCPPTQVSHISFYIDQEFEFSIGESDPRLVKFSLSHLEIVTVDHLAQRMKDLFVQADQNGRGLFFPYSEY